MHRMKPVWKGHRFRRPPALHEQILIDNFPNQFSPRVWETTRVMRAFYVVVGSLKTVFTTCICFAVFREHSSSCFKGTVKTGYYSGAAIMPGLCVRIEGNYYSVPFFVWVQLRCNSLCDPAYFLLSDRNSQSISCFDVWLWGTSAARLFITSSSLKQNITQTFELYKKDMWSQILLHVVSIKYWHYRSEQSLSQQALE